MGLHLTILRTIPRFVFFFVHLKICKKDVCCRKGSPKVALLSQTLRCSVQIGKCVKIDYGLAFPIGSMGLVYLPYMNG